LTVSSVESWPPCAGPWRSQLIVDPFDELRDWEYEIFCFFVDMAFLGDRGLGEFVAVGFVAQTL